jgi:GLPGLI family protein
MGKKIYITVLISLLCLTVKSQYAFITSGKIQYEKRTNQFKILDRSTMDRNMVDEVKKTASKILIDRYDLVFNSTRSVYKLAALAPDNKYFVMPAPLETEYIAKDLFSRQLYLQKDVFSNSFSVQDSLDKYDWKIINETRTIAGFECKKAVARIFDSVYVVAFFTTEIIPSNGPESFSGLPGMILEIAIPRLFTTWVATKVELIIPDETALSPVIKNKRITKKEFLNGVFKLGDNLPEDARKMLWMFGI